MYTCPLIQQWFELGSLLLGEENLMLEILAGEFHCGSAPSMYVFLVRAFQMMPTFLEKLNSVEECNVAKMI